MAAELLQAAATKAASVSKERPRPPRRVRQILRLYLETPSMVDSLEGIAQWRLIEHIVQRRVDETAAALEWLVEERYLERRTRIGSSPVYRLNAERRGDAERLVEGRRRS